jgi:hypothetical protein
VISAITESPSSGDLNAGKTVIYTLTMSEVVTVNTTGGTPTLTFNDGGTATYTGGSGSNALTFSYTVLAGQNTPDLMVSAVNLNGATLLDGAGNAANLSLTGVTQGSPQIDTTPPTVSSVTATAGDYNAGNALALTLNMSEAVNVTGTPTLTLNDGGTATYTGGSGTSALTFSYTVGAAQNTSGLAVTAVSGTIADLAGNTLSTANLPETFAGVIVDTTSPTVSTVSASAGDYNAGKALTLTLNMSEAVNVTGTPTLTLNDGGTATYTGGTGTSALTFSYTVGAGQNTSGLAVTAVNGTIANLAGTALSTATLPETFAGVIVDTTTPSVKSVAASGTGITAGAGDLGAGSVVTLTLNMSEAVNVTGTPTLTLNDGGTATYTGGTGTSALTFSYTVAAGQNTPDLTVTSVNLGTATVADLAGNAANLTGAVTNPAGTLQIQTAPTVNQVIAQPGTGVEVPGELITIALHMSEAVKVSGSPTLTLNDGRSATYVSGSGTSTLTFSYKVSSSDIPVAALAITGVNLAKGKITDTAGHAANLSGVPSTFAGLEIDPRGPVLTAINASVAATDGQAFVASSLFTYTDPLNLAATGYHVYDAGAGGGHLVLNGVVLASGSDNYLTPAQMAQLIYVSGTASDTLKVQADDGAVWGAWSSIGTKVSLGSVAMETIAAGATLELTSANSGTILFAGATGTLKIDNAASFTGKIAGQLAVGDKIDLANITAGAQAQISYSGNDSPGTLTISDGTNTAYIALLGDYSLGNFKVSSDGHGGTIVVDPPIASQSGPSTGSSGDFPAGVDRTLGLWSQYIASHLPDSGHDTGGSNFGVSDWGGGQVANLSQPGGNHLHG